MKKIVIRSLVAAVLFTGLAACEDKQGDTHVTYKAPQPKHAPGADTISAADETMAPVSRVAQEDETDDRLAFGERSKHGQYYVSTTDAQFYPVKGAKQINTQYIVVSVQFQRTPNEHSTVVTFTLQDTATYQTYEPSDGGNLSTETPHALWTAFSSPSLSDDEPLNLDVAFKIPKKANHTYNLLITQQSERADVFKFEEAKQDY
ncbi:hypothetical protein Q4S57_13470 [Priestia megaterium]|uniref:hypothetical protein n=1 Tax=Priestia megaterium TaxID=1404 RepID=UPI0026E1E703|nr:hypothetical protein [Priestia megaterium]MDO6848965.1 hypothetical protein [Priestia megaterium]